jgi:hypothetical protein
MTIQALFPHINQQSNVDPLQSIDLKDILGRLSQEQLTNLSTMSTDGKGLSDAAGGSNWMGDAFGTKDNVGWLTGGVSALSGLANAWTGLQQLKLGKESLGLQKDAFKTNLANQAQTINTQLGDRQSARLGASGVSTNSAQGSSALADYLSNNSVSGKVG